MYVCLDVCRACRYGRTLVWAHGVLNSQWNEVINELSYKYKLISAPSLASSGNAFVSAQRLCFCELRDFFSAAPSGSTVPNHDHGHEQHGWLCQLAHGMARGHLLS